VYDLSIGSISSDPDMPTLKMKKRNPRIDAEGVGRGYPPPPGVGSGEGAVPPPQKIFGFLTSKW